MIKLESSESPLSHIVNVSAAVSTDAAEVKSAAHNLAVSSETVLSVIAPISVANVELVVDTADASIASLNLDHDVELVSNFSVVVGVLNLIYVLSLLLLEAAVASVVVRSGPSLLNKNVVLIFGRVFLLNKIRGSFNGSTFRVLVRV